MLESKEPLLSPKAQHRKQLLICPVAPTDAPRWSTGIDVDALRQRAFEALNQKGLPLGCRETGQSLLRVPDKRVSKKLMGVILLQAPIGLSTQGG